MDNGQCYLDALDRSGCVMGKYPNIKTYIRNQAHDQADDIAQNLNQITAKLKITAIAVRQLATNLPQVEDVELEDFESVMEQVLELTIDLDETSQEQITEQLHKIIQMYFMRLERVKNE